MNWLKNILIEKWLGRLLTVALASLGGVLASLGVEQAIVTGWIDATSQLVGALLPILIAIILDQLQHKVALKTLPPK